MPPSGSPERRSSTLKTIAVACGVLLFVGAGCAVLAKLGQMTTPPPASSAAPQPNRPLTAEEQAQISKDTAEANANFRAAAERAAAAAPSGKPTTPIEAPHSNLDDVDAECSFGSGVVVVKNTGKVPWRNAQLTLNPSGFLRTGGFKQATGAVQPHKFARLALINFADEDGTRFNPYARMVTESKLKIVLADGGTKTITFR